MFCKTSLTCKYVIKLVIFLFILTSFVRSVSMDKWKDIELEKMKAGGNRKAKQFLESQPDYNSKLPLSDKYNTKAAALYRDKVSFFCCLICKLFYRKVQFFLNFIFK